MKRPLYIVLGFLTLALFLLAWIYLPTLTRYHDMKRRQEEMEFKIEDLAGKIESLKEERNLLKNDVSYLEKVIRDELGLVKPGEIVYKFVPEKTE